MAKQSPTKVVKLQLHAGKANPAPPVGTVLGPTGINMQDFCSQFNDATRDKMGEIIPCVINIYEDRTFDFTLKQPPASFLVMRAAGVTKGSSLGSKENIATLTQAQLREIAEIKLVDLNAYDVESGMKILAGTAKNMGITVEGLDTNE